MTNTKHTPAPWKYADADIRPPWPSYAILDEDGCTIVPPMQNIANVRLICNAPELLDLLHVILMQHKTDGAYSSKGGVTLSPAMERHIEEAIKKARGE